MSKKKVIKINNNTTEKDILPEFLFERIIHYIDTARSIYDDYTTRTTAVNFIEERNGFRISEDQFHRLVNEIFTVYVKNNKKWYNSLDPSTYSEMFGFIGLFLQMNGGALFTEENVLYVLQSFVKNINTLEDSDYEILMDFRDGVSTNAFPVFGIERILNISIVDESAIPHIQNKQLDIHGKILDFICENYEKFLVQIKDYSNSEEPSDRNILIPGIQVVIPWPLEFVEKHYDVFLAPTFSLNPISQQVHYQLFLLGKMTEDFLNRIYHAIDPTLPELKRTEGDILLSLIEYRKI